MPNSLVCAACVACARCAVRGCFCFILVHSIIQTIEYAAVQSWSWNNQYNLPDPGQTFEAILWDGGDVLFQYLDM